MTMKYSKKETAYRDFSPSWRFLTQNPVSFFAFGFGAGLSPKAPGTAGSLVGFPVAWAVLALIPRDPNRAWMLAAAALALFLAGVPICARSEKQVMRKDYGGIVFDEIAAMAGLLFFVPCDPLYWAAAFVFFRVFDIFKPQPVGWVDQNTSGGFSIMIDDTLAAAYAWLCVLAMQWGAHWLGFRVPGLPF